MDKKKFLKAFFLVLFTQLSFFSFLSEAQAKEKIRVGLFQNFPIVFQDQDGIPQGIYVDFLEEIARIEGWELSYVPDKWNNCLDNLRHKKIDLMTNITYTKERDTYIDFSTENVLMMWGQVYVNEDIQIQNILDMDGLKVAILQNGINAINFTNLIEKFQINCELVAVDDQLKILKMTSSGETDAGVINNVFGMAHANNFNIKLSPVLFNPFKLLFAVPENENSELLTTIDSHIKTWKKSDASVYHSILKKWYGNINPSPKDAPRWIFPILWGGCFIIFFLILSRHILKKQVQKSTDDLRRVNDSLKQEMAGRQKTEKDLKESEKKYKALFRSSSDAIFLVDVESLDLIDANEKAVELYGYTYSELLNKKATDLSAEAEKTRKGLQQEFPTEIPICYHQKKDGTVFPVEITASYFYLEGKKINLSDIRDISKRIKTEESLKLSESRLQQSQKMESIGTLAGGIAHDFNNILASILGFSEIVLENVQKGSEMEEDVKEILKAGQRAKELVKQILIFARKSDEKIHPVKIEPIAHEALKLLRSSIPANIEISASIDSKLTIMGNETQVHQIFMNLCTNAAHAMEKNGGILSISVTDTTITKPFYANSINLKPGHYVTIEISDTGSGIPSDIIDSIFDPYFSTKETGEGTGLGLATVHGIVEKYSGQIKVKSKVNKGSSFTIFLPANHGELTTSETIEDKLPKGHETILIVDDERAITKMNRRLLESLGYKIIETNNSLEALNIFKQNPNNFDLIVTDMTMPKITGDKLAEAIFKIKTDTPVILCTGYSKIISKEEARNKGISAYIEKPVDKKDLARTIRQVLDEV
jgi:PAS domain S-box-containing protein